MKRGENKSESKSPKNKTPKSTNKRPTDKNLSIKVISQHSQPVEAENLRNSMI